MGEVKRGRLDRVEQICKIISMLAIPALLAVGGWLVQSSLSQSAVQQEYVKLAVSILSSPRNENIDILRPWAVKLLSTYSPVPLTEEQYRKLESGEIRLSMDVVKAHLLDDKVKEKIRENLRP